MHGEKRTLVFNIGRAPEINVQKVPIVSTPSTNFGTTRWQALGKLHREDGPAVEWGCGDKDWYINGKRHRVDGPAEELKSGTKAWWVHDKRHREDGPAIEYYRGNNKWYLHGKQLTEEEHREVVAVLLGSRTS